MKYVKIQEEAEDAVQDSFASIWMKKGIYSGRSALIRYLYICVHNKCLDILRHKSVECITDTEINSIDIPDEDLDAEIFAGEIYSRVFQKIDELPERQRTTIKLAMEGKTNAEIAEEMHVALDTVKNQKFKAYATLRKHFAQHILLMLIPMTL